MSHRGWELALYCIGALAGLVIKFIRHLWDGWDRGLDTRALVKLWFRDNGSLENRVSWLSSGVGVWFLGVLVVYRLGTHWLVELLVPEAAPAIVHLSFSLFIGTLAEYIVPSLIKFVLKKFSFGGQV